MREQTPWTILPALAPSVEEIDAIVQRQGEDEPRPVESRQASIERMSRVQLVLVRLRLGQRVAVSDIELALADLAVCSKRHGRMSDGAIRMQAIARVLRQALQGRPARIDWCIDAVRHAHEEIYLLRNSGSMR